MEVGTRSDDEVLGRAIKQVQWRHHRTLDARMRAIGSTIVQWDVLRALEGHVFVAHNAAFDWRFVSAEVARARGRELAGRRLCTVRLARRILPQLRSRSLDWVARHYDVEIAPGTQWDTGETFEHEMFPPRSAYGRYSERAVRKYPQMGDVSVRSALTIHRGTANHSARARPVLVLGVDAPDGGNAAHHDLAVTRDYWESLPPSVRDHLGCPVVDELTPITQKHTIEGLVMGE